jgi:hypothetical protein
LRGAELDKFKAIQPQRIFVSAIHSLAPAITGFKI